jgi:hypothetical protein
MFSFHAGRRTPYLVALLLFVNTGGSYLVLVRLSTQVETSTHSGLLSGGVLAAPWLAAMLLAAPLNRLLSRRPPGRLVRLAEPASLVLTLAAAAAPGRPLLAVATGLLLARGYFEAITRSGTTVLLRGTVDPRRLNQANTVSEIGRLAGTSVGSALAGPLAGALPLRGFILVNAATLAVTTLLGQFLPPAPAGGGTPAKPGTARRGAGLRRVSPELRVSFARFLLVAFWQGFHTVAVVVLPVALLHGGAGLVGVFVAMSAVAVFAGSLAAWPVQRYLGRLPAATWALVPMPFLVTAIMIGRTGPTFAFYAVFLVFFEVAYVYYNNKVLGVAGPGEVATVVTLRATLLPAGVVVATLGLGEICDLAGLLTAAVVLAAITVAVTAAGEVRGWRIREIDSRSVPPFLPA